MRVKVGGIEFDSASFVGATYGRYGRKYPMRTYDNGFGPLWAYRETLGVLGIVRAQTWEDAWECCEDEILDDADAETLRVTSEDELPEGCGYRPNGRGNFQWNRTGVYQQDLNGNSLDLLTPDMMEEYGITIQWELS